MSSDRRPLTPLMLLSVAAAVLYAVFIERSSFLVGSERFYTLFDDAMVSMRYALNLAHGAGLTWNPGDPPVEGYSNFLWTLVMAAVHLLPVDLAHTSLVVMVLGAVLLLLNGLLVQALIFRLTQNRWLGVLGAACCLSSYALVFWTLRGQEVGLVSLLCLLAIWIGTREPEMRRRHVWVGVLCSAIYLTRPDGLAFSGVVLLYFIIETPRERRLRVALQLLSPLVATIVVHVAWRLATYGEWLPNTYYLKMTGTPVRVRMAAGAYYLWLLVVKNSWPLVLLLVLIVCLRAKQLGGRWVFLVLFLVQVLYSVYVGGDAWEAFRFANRYLAQALPLLFVFVFAAFSSSSNRVVIALATLACLAPSIRPWSYWYRNNHHYYADNVRNTRLAKQLEASVDRDTRIAVVWAGAIPYYSGLWSVDLLGKCDKHVARLPARDQRFFPGHMKWDLVYSLSTYEPEIMTSLWWLASDEEKREVYRLGYRETAAGYWVMRKP